MTLLLQSTIGAQLGWTWRDQTATAPIVDSNRLAVLTNLPNGTGVNESNAVWHIENQSLDSGTSTTLDLDLLERPLFADTLTTAMETVKAILIVHTDAASAGYLEVGGASTDEWYAPFGAAGATVKVMPGSPLLLTNLVEGWDVSIGQTALQLAAVGGNVTFDIAILGILAGTSSSSSSSSS